MASKEIIAGSADGSDVRAVAAARLFAWLLGTVAGNLAPIHLPFGSIYLVGGVACAFSPLLADFSFLEAFHDKGRFAGFMFNFSVSVIDDDYAALTGAAAHLVELKRRSGQRILIHIAQANETTTQERKNQGRLICPVLPSIPGQRLSSEVGDDTTLFWFSFLGKPWRSSPTTV